MKITDMVAQLAAPLVEECGCTLWDVVFVREGGQYYLRLLIDKDGGVSINDCEAVSRKVDPVLDEKDFIAQSYIFEVWSAGIERPLKRPSDFELFMGSSVLAKLYSPIDGKKELVGTLRGYDNGTVTIQTGEDNVALKKGEYSLVRLTADF